MFEAVATYPGYGMATLIYNNLLNIILGTVMFLIIILGIGYLILKQPIYRFDRKKTDFRFGLYSKKYII